MMEAKEQCTIQVDQDMFHCVVCWDALSTGVQQCAAGAHNVCASCVCSMKRVNTRKCPVCRVEGFCANARLEREIRSLQVPCSNPYCTVKTLPWMLEAHRSECAFRNPIRCPTCEMEMTGQPLLEHFEQHCAQKYDIPVIKIQPEMVWQAPTRPTVWQMEPGYLLLGCPIELAEHWVCSKKSVPPRLCAFQPWCVSGLPLERVLIWRHQTSTFVFDWTYQDPIVLPVASGSPMQMSFVRVGDLIDVMDFQDQWCEGRVLHVRHKTMEMQVQILRSSAKYEIPILSSRWALHNTATRRSLTARVFQGSQGSQPQSSQGSQPQSSQGSQPQSSQGSQPQGSQPVIELNPFDPSVGASLQSLLRPMIRPFLNDPIAPDTSESESDEHEASDNEHESPEHESPEHERLQNEHNRSHSNDSRVPGRVHISIQNADGDLRHMLGMLLQRDMLPP